MKPMKFNDVVKLLEGNGFILLRSNGHMVFGCNGIRIALAHQRVVSVGVMRSVFKAIKNAKSDFREEQACA